MYNSLGEKQETKQQLKYVGKEKESEKKTTLRKKPPPPWF